MATLLKIGEIKENRCNAWLGLYLVGIYIFPFLLYLSLSVSPSLIPYFSLPPSAPLPLRYSCPLFDASRFMGIVVAPTHPTHTRLHRAVIALSSSCVSARSCHPAADCGTRCPLRHLSALMRTGGAAAEFSGALCRYSDPAVCCCCVVCVCVLGVARRLRSKPTTPPATLNPGRASVPSVCHRLHSLIDFLA